MVKDEVLSIILAVAGRRTMMWSNKEIAAEALRRATVIKERRKRRRELLITGVLISACLSLFVCLSLIPGQYGGAGPTAQAAVTIFDGETAGGYVLAGVIGFALGGLAMFICLRRAKKSNENGRHEI